MLVAHLHKCAYSTSASSQPPLLLYAGCPPPSRLPPARCARFARSARSGWARTRCTIDVRLDSVQVQLEQRWAAPRGRQAPPHGLVGPAIVAQAERQVAEAPQLADRHAQLVAGRGRRGPVGGEPLLRVKSPERARHPSKARVSRQPPPPTTTKVPAVLGEVGEGGQQSARHRSHTGDVKSIDRKWALEVRWVRRVKVGQVGGRLLKTPQGTSRRSSPSQQLTRPEATSDAKAGSKTPFHFGAECGSS
jgi:hypothetical protein